ncbi:MAG: DegT/DnrJ/EryC1/StrS family aminotransferase [Alsobacter sp.]
MIPFLELKPAFEELEEEISSAVDRVLRSGWYIGGTEVEAFEEAFATACAVEHCVGVANGLDALHLALRALGIGEGDEVIVPSNTFIATWLAVSHCGAVPVPVEPRQDTCNIDVDLIEAAITPRTRAIIPVHLYGQPADLDPILAIARNRGLAVVEDAAQAHGAAYKGRRIGGHGDLCCWSFYPGKNLGAMGDAGAVTTRSADLAERLRMLRNYGSSERYVNDVIGYNSRLDPMQAAILAAKLPHLDEWNERRRSIARLYAQRLEGTGLALPTTPSFADPVWHLYVVRHPRRDALQKALAGRGVGTLIHYPIPPHRQSAYAGSPHSARSLPVAEAMASQVLSLPMGPHLSLQDASAVADALVDILESQIRP